jgi:hypothetical protein
VARVAGDDREAVDEGGGGDPAVTGAEAFDRSGPGLVQSLHFGRVRKGLKVLEVAQRLQQQAVGLRHPQGVHALGWV